MKYQERGKWSKGQSRDVYGHGSVIHCTLLSHFQLNEINRWWVIVLDWTSWIYLDLWNGMPLVSCHLKFKYALQFWSYLLLINWFATWNCCACEHKNGVALIIIIIVSPTTIPFFSHGCDLRKRKWTETSWWMVLSE